MIVSASRRTDIPAYYSEWMVNRLKEGYVLVPNPRNTGRLTRVILDPERVDCIVFWSKDPKNILEKLPQIDEMGYRYYFEYTITAFGTEEERNLPDKQQEIDTFLRLSEQIGSERVDWRFDPVMVTERYPVDWHLRKFEDLCRKLHGHTERCIISFIDPYRHLGSEWRGMSAESIRETASGLARIAECYGLPLYTCAEEIELSEFGIRHAACIDPKKVEKVAGFPIVSKKDPGQRPACGCMASVDIGMYDTCGHGCRYCYATFYNEGALKKRMSAHRSDSPMLIGEPDGNELITEKKDGSLKILQMKLPFEV